MSSVVVENVNEAGETDSFNSGKKIKNKDEAKSDILMDLMIDKITIEAEGREKKEEKQEQRFETKELRADKLVNILENLAQHLMKE